MIPFLMACNGCILVSILSGYLWHMEHGRRNGWERRMAGSRLIRLECGLEAPSPVHILSRLLPISTQLQHQLTPFPRRRHANDHKSNKMAHRRRSNRPPTRLVPRPRHSLLLYESRVRHQRPRRRTTQHVVPHGSSLPNCWTKQESLSRLVLLASSAATSEYDGEGGR